MLSMFLTTAKQVSILVFYVVCGFVLVKTKILSGKASKVIAALLTYFIGPIYTILNLAEGISLDNIINYLYVFLAGIVFVVIAIVVSIFLTNLFAKDKNEKGMYKYIFAFSNYGYFGYPLIQVIFGQEILVMFMIFVIPTQIIVSSYGYYILTDRDDIEKVRKKNICSSFFSPPMVATIIGLIIGLLPISLPQIVIDFVKPASACYSVLPMILVGVVLGNSKLSVLFTSLKSYIVGIIRLVVMPAFFVGLLYLLHILGLSSDIILSVFVMECLPCGLNVVVFPESVGADSTNAARVCFISYVMGLITIPIAFAFLQLII